MSPRKPAKPSSKPPVAGKPPEPVRPTIFDRPPSAPLADPQLLRAEGLLRLCKLHGVLRGRLGEFEFEFAPVAAPVAGPVPADMRDLAQAFADGSVTDEQALFHSAPQAVTPEQVEAYRKQLLGG